MDCHSALSVLRIPWQEAVIPEITPTRSHLAQLCPLQLLTVHGHAHGDALLEATELALVAGDLVNDTAAVIFAGVGGMEVLLDCAAKEALGWREMKHGVIVISPSLTNHAVSPLGCGGISEGAWHPPDTSKPKITWLGQRNIETCALSS